MQTLGRRDYAVVGAASPPRLPSTLADAWQCAPAPQAFIDLLDGANTGKMLVRL